MVMKSIIKTSLSNPNKIEPLKENLDSPQSYPHFMTFLTETFFIGWRDVSDSWGSHLQRMMPDIEVAGLLEDVSALIAARHDEYRLDQIVHAETNSDFNVYRDAGVDRITLWLRNLRDMLISTALKY